MNQRDLFSVFDDCERTRARNSDPSTSFEAAHRIASSGELSRQQAAVYELLQKHDGSTSAELGRLIGDRYLPARRLPELADKKQVVRRGNARVCAVKGTPAVTWWVV